MSYRRLKLGALVTKQEQRWEKNFPVGAPHDVVCVVVGTWKWMQASDGSPCKKEFFNEDPDFSATSPEHIRTGYLLLPAGCVTGFRHSLFGDVLVGLLKELKN